MCIYQHHDFSIQVMWTCFVHISFQEAHRFYFIHSFTLNLLFILMNTWTHCDAENVWTFSFLGDCCLELFSTFLKRRQFNSSFLLSHVNVALGKALEPKFANYLSNGIQMCACLRGNGSQLYLSSTLSTTRPLNWGDKI